MCLSASISNSEPHTKLNASGSKGYSSMKEKSPAGRLMLLRLWMARLLIRLATRLVGPDDEWPLGV
jgi:hypothetical protein